MSEIKYPWFHVEKGLYFDKLAGDLIRIRVCDPKDESKVKFVLSLNHDSFASVMSFLSKSGDTAEKWVKAKEFLNS